jgi:hypothetical protein
MICKRPAGSKTGFASELYRELLGCVDVQPPFNRLIEFSLTAMPTWREAERSISSSTSSTTGCGVAGTASATFTSWSPSCTSRCSTAHDRCGNCTSSTG